MDEQEARSLKVGDEVIYQIGNSILSTGGITKVYWGAFEVLWNDNVRQVIAYNEAHNIYRPEKTHENG
jgi:hypothetical protein